MAMILYALSYIYCYHPVHPLDAFAHNMKIISYLVKHTHSFLIHSLVITAQIDQLFPASHFPPVKNS
jgi:hypothetical protein